MRKTLTGRIVYSRSSHRRSQLGSREMLSADECLRDRIVASPNRPRIDVQIAPVVRHRLLHARCSERQHPPNVLRCDEVPRRTKHMRPENLPLADLSLDVRVCLDARPHTKRPLRTGVILRLHGAEGANDVACRRRPTRGEKLTREPTPNDVAVVRGTSGH
jgi:hypothetical protein